MLNETDLQGLKGYLESIRNLSICADVLIDHNHQELLPTILEEIAQNSQLILDNYCVIDDEER